MERVYLDCTGLPHSIPVRSELPNSIYVDASDLQRVLDNFLQGFTYAIAEGMKANPVENFVRQGVSQPVLRTDIEEKYNELIMAVATKFTNETRHETALRYIKEAENFNDNSCAKNESEQSA